MINVMRNFNEIYFVKESYQDVQISFPDLLSRKLLGGYIFIFIPSFYTTFIFTFISGKLKSETMFLFRKRRMQPKQRESLHLCRNRRSAGETILTTGMMTPVLNPKSERSALKRDQHNPSRSPKAKLQPSVFYSFFLICSIYF